MESIISSLISRVFIFLLLGIAASIIQEALAAFVSARSAYLAMGIRGLLADCVFDDGDPLIDKFYSHGFIRSLYLYKPPKAPRGLADRCQRLFRYILLGRHTHDIAGAGDSFTLPSSIPGRVFGMVIIDILNVDKLNGKTALFNIEKQVLLLHKSSALSNSNQTHGTSQALIAMLVDAAQKENILSEFQTNLEQWFDCKMESVTRGYQRYVEYSLIIMGLLIAMIFNVDSIRIARAEWMDKDARQAIQQAQDNYLKKSISGGVPLNSSMKEELTKIERTAAEVRYEVNSQYMPIGWNYSVADYKYMFYNPEIWNLTHIIELLTGWLVTAYAISLLAKIWFDTLKRTMPLLSGRKL